MTMLYFLLGSGVSRDGLVLLMGERYALHQQHQNTAISDDMHAFPANFGSKGEALSSISDVYLLELLPKLMRGQMDIDGKCFCTLELMSVDKMIVQHLIIEDDLLCRRASPSPCCCCPVGLGFI